MASLINKLQTKKNQIQNELTATETEIDFLKKKKLDYINLYTEEIIIKAELQKYRTLADQKIQDSQTLIAQLQNKLKECAEESYSINLSKKLKEFLTLKVLSPQVLHSLVEKITCSNEGNIHIHYNFVNPLREAAPPYDRGLTALF
ncbi:hypothetical protein PDQ04_16070 [Bacillus cereus]|nr:hypothetical protein [Bacillus cereus]